eukprot:3852165-Ditylum_brightwellii.AAC.1
MDLKDIYKFFTVQGYPPGAQILIWTLPYNCLPETKADAAIQTFSTLEDVKDLPDMSLQLLSQRNYSL